MRIKLMTFNTQHCKNYITNKIDYDAIRELIKKYNPDIVGLNEIYGKGYDKTINNTQAHEIANKLGYYCYFGKATNLLFKPYGNAILSKYPLIDPTIIKIPFPFIKHGNKYYERRSILNTKIKVQDELLSVTITHLGLNIDEQIHGITTLYKCVGNFRCIIMGDFNCPPNNEIITPLKSAMKDTLKYNEKDYTWPSDNPKIRDDYILVSNDITVLSSKVLDEVVSDHRPIIAEIEILKH